MSSKHLSDLVKNSVLVSRMRMWDDTTWFVINVLKAGSVRQEKSHLIWKSAIITLSCTNYKQTYCLRVYADQSRERWSMIMCHSSSLKEGQLLREVTPDRWTQRLGCVSFSLCFPSYSTSLSCFACSPQALRRDEPLASIYLSTKRFRLWPTFHCSKIRATSIWAKKGRSELPCQKWA